jgi:hypothetical protein
MRSRVTVTAACEVATRSIDTPSSSNGAKARARKPGTSHIASVESVSSVTPRRQVTAVTAG